MAEFPPNYLDLVNKKVAFASLATLMPDGTPQVTPIWFDYSDGVIHLNTAIGRVKAQNMQTGAPVALSIVDPDNAYRYLQVRGKIAHMTEDGAVAHIDSLAKKYLGKDVYPWHNAKDVRVMYEVEPMSVQAMG